MRLRFNRWPALMLLGMGAATWPVWRWYILRITDGSDEPWGLLALLALVVLRLRDGAGPCLEERDFRIPAVVLLLYLATYHAFVPLLRAMMGIGAFALILLRGQRAAGLWGLLGLHALSLPVMATLQFYAGHPLCLLSASGSARVLQCCGLGVDREGTLLRWAGETVMMDAPCSGVHMLWAGMFLALLLAAFHRMNGWRTLLTGSAAVAIVVGGNVVRTTALFFKESHLIDLPAWTHAGIGLVIFGIGTGLILSFAERLKELRTRTP